MKKYSWWCFLILITFVGMSCNTPTSPYSESVEDLASLLNPTSTPESEESEIKPQPVPSENLIQPEDFTYLGFFRLPASSGGSNWGYSGQGLTFFPGGDPEGPKDCFSGSLFGFGHDHQLFVSEISIPVPVITSNLEEASTAKTLQPFADLTGGIFSTEEMTIPRAGIAFLAEPEPRLHFTFGQHFQDFESSHGWSTLNLSNPEAEGPWKFAGYTNYVTNDYLFEIPAAWAETIAPGPLLASGRAREGLWSGRGPALFAYAPGDLEAPLPPGGTLTNVMPLLLYGEQLPDLPGLVSTPDQSVVDFKEADHWRGGEWLTAGDSAAVVFAGTKALGEEWYGFANGLVWEHDCAEQTPPTCPESPDWPYDDRGFWAEDYQSQLIFYDPTQLVAVAQGELKSWQPQLYAVLILDEVLLSSFLDPAAYKRDIVGAVAFDRAHGIFYLMERLADGDRSVVHVWQLQQ